MEIGCLATKVVVVLQPVYNVVIGKRLWPYTRGVDALVTESGYHVAGVLLLCVVPLERHWDGSGWRFELGSEVTVAWIGVYKIDVLIKG